MVLNLGPGTLTLTLTLTLIGCLRMVLNLDPGAAGIRRRLVGVAPRGDGVATDVREVRVLEER